MKSSRIVHTDFDLLYYYHHGKKVIIVITYTEAGAVME